MNECDRSSRIIPEEMNEIRGWISLFTNPKARIGDTLAQGPQRHSTDAPFSFKYGAHWSRTSRAAELHIGLIGG